MEPMYRRLTSPHSDLIIKTHPYAEIVWWGSTLKHFSPDDCISLERPVANGRLDTDTPLTLMAENGAGLFGSPGLEGHRNGLDASPVFRTISVVQAGESLTLTSEDAVAGLRMVSELVLTSSGVLKMRHALTNLREGDWQVNRFAITLPVAERAEEVMAFHGRWTREFQPHRVRLTHDGFVLENRRGRTSHEHFPALIAGAPGFSEQQGEVWAVHLGWSGNHRMKCEVKTDGRRYLQAEALWMPGEKALKKDETVYTPWLYASYSPEGLNGMSQQYHRFLRDEIIRFPEQKPRPVHLNTWEGIYFDHDPNYIMQMAGRAAALGVERFIIDDGWFKGRNDDHAALGDWYLDEQKYPDG
ncbi:TPA: glycoside hydrolase family 36 N-terminal domain-containing protein, partial [Escherichia coli]|nr:alpha-galactosidase [Escherichia coli]